MADDRVTQFEAAYDIGEKVLEAMDRVKNMQRIVPGTGAKWKVRIDGTWFEIDVKIVKVPGDG